MKAHELPIDTSVKIPQAVLAAKQRADELLSSTAMPPPPEPVEDEQASEEVEATEQAEQEQHDAEGAGQEAPGFDDPAPETASDEQPEAEESETREPDWERRLARMKGRYEKERERVSQLSEEIQNLHKVLANLQSAPRQAAAPEETFQAERLITPEEEADYGPEFLGIVEKKAREVFGPLQQKYETRIKQLEEQLGGIRKHTETTSRQQFLDALTTEVPQWRELNKDEEFLGWLQEVDSYSGQQRHSMLKSAYERNDAHRVAAFFKGFLREEAAVAPATPHPSQTGRSSAPGKASLERMAAPGRAKPTATTSVPADDKPIITRADIAQFYRDVNAGRYNGKEAEKKQFEDRIFKATAEGRVR